MTTPARPLIPLAWHAAGALLLEEARAGREAPLIVGSKGTGKSYFVKSSASPRGTPRRLVYLSVGDVRSGAGLLTAVLDSLHDDYATSLDGMLSQTSGRARRRGATHLLKLCAAELHRLDIGALALDEAPFLSTPALAHAMQLVDHCAERFGHKLGVVLISTDQRHKALQKTGELGQRISTVLEVPPLTGEQVEAALLALSGPVARCLASAGVRARAEVMDALINKVDGAVRRLDRIVQRAEGLAAHRGTAMRLDDVKTAVRLQADSI